MPFGTFRREGIGVLPATRISAYRDGLGRTKFVAKVAADISARQRDGNGRAPPYLRREGEARCQRTTLNTDARLDHRLLFVKVITPGTVTVMVRFAPSLLAAAGEALD